MGWARVRVGRGLRRTRRTSCIGIPLFFFFLHSLSLSLHTKIFILIPSLNSLICTKLFHPLVCKVWPWPLAMGMGYGYGFGMLTWHLQQTHAAKQHAYSHALWKFFFSFSFLFPPKISFLVSFLFPPPLSQHSCIFANERG